MTAPAYGEMHDELAQFEAALHEAARAIVLEVLTAEYTRRIAAGEGPIAELIASRFSRVRTRMSSETSSASRRSATICSSWWAICLSIVAM